MRLEFLTFSHFFFSLYPLIPLLQFAFLLYGFQRNWIPVLPIPFLLSE